MPDYRPESVFDSDIQSALDAISSFTGPVLVDLDETLFLRNSTEEFINCAVPSLLALLLLRVLDVVKPWRWSGGNVTRDVWRVRFIFLLFPWTPIIWKRRVPSLAKQYINRPLAMALTSGQQQPTIVTVGFASIVTPLIGALGFSRSQITSSRLSTCEDRRNGKLAMARASLGDETVRRSLLITDSIDDVPILEVCAKPLRVVWPDAKYHRALTHTYVPGQYIALVKRPGERYIFRGIFQEDFAFWVLSSIALAPQPLLHLAGLFFLLLSFWSIYERGYVDNDFVAATYETAPKLSANYWEAPVATPALQPWIWALASGTIAILLLRMPEPPKAADLVKWLAVLVGTYAWFKLYNRYDKSTRVWMFSVLQFMRGAAFLVLVPATEIGVLAVGAHILARWVPYFLYRFGGSSWLNTLTQTLRLLFFIVLAALFATTRGHAAILTWTTALLLAWNVFRARNELGAIIRGASRIDGTVQVGRKDVGAKGPVE